MAELKGSEYIARIMKEEGVEQYFGVHGGHIWQMMSSVAKEGIRLVHMRHEQSGVYAADGWGRTTRTPGVCFGTAGPGMANMVSALLHSSLCKSPVVALMGQHTITYDGWGPFQEGYAAKITPSFTKWTQRIIDFNTISYWMRKAFRDAIQYPAGPVVVEIPTELLGKKGAEEDQLGYLPKGRCADPSRPAGDPALVEKAVRMLIEAKKPIVIGGDGIFWADAAAELKEFVELLNIPVHTRRAGRGAVPEGHPLAFSGGYRRPILNQSDVMAIIGLRMSMLEHFAMPPTYPAENVRYIQVSEDLEELTIRLPTEVSIYANPKLVLRQMIDCAKDILKEKPDRSEWLSFVSKAKEAATLQLKEEVDAVRTHSPIHPEFLAQGILDFLDKDATIILDSFSMAGFITDKIEANFAGQILDSGTYGGVGHGVGMAIGAQLGRPGKQVIDLLGDGGLGIAGWDIETAARNNLPVCYLIFNNSSWISKPAQGMVLPAVKETWGMLDDIRYDKIFAEMGCHTELVREPEELRPALERAFNSGKTMAINVVPDNSIFPPQLKQRMEHYKL